MHNFSQHSEISHFNYFVYLVNVNCKVSKSLTFYKQMKGKMCGLLGVLLSYCCDVLAIMFLWFISCIIRPTHISIASSLDKFVLGQSHSAEIFCSCLHSVPDSYLKVLFNLNAHAVFLLLPCLLVYVITLEIGVEISRFHYEVLIFI